MDINNLQLEVNRLREQLAVFEALSHDYLNVFKINMEEQTAEIIKLDGYVTKGMDKTKAIAYPYDVLVKQYIKDRVYPGDAERLAAEMNLDVVKEMIDKNKEYVSNYRAIVGSEVHFYQFKYIKPNGDFSGDKIIAGFKNIDAQIKAAKERAILLEMSEMDSMTKLLNRGCGENRATDLIKSGTRGMFCIFDIDKFKSVNDTFGHNAGDKVIIAVANSIKNAFRDGDIVFRLGGDEFAVFTRDVENEETGRRIIERIFTNLDNIKVAEIGERKISISVGATIVNEINCFGFLDIYKQADNAVYESKKTDGNCLSFYNSL